MGEPEASKPEENNNETTTAPDEYQQPATPEPQGDGEVNDEMEDMQNDENTYLHEEEEAKFEQNYDENMPEIEIPIPDYYNVNIEHQNSGYLITYGIVAPHKMVVRVTLTSTLLRKDIKAKEEEDQKKHEEMIAEQKRQFEEAEAKKKQKELEDQKESSEPPEKVAKLTEDGDKAQTDEKSGESTENKETPAENEKAPEAQEKT